MVAAEKAVVTKKAPVAENSAPVVEEAANAATEGKVEEAANVATEGKAAANQVVAEGESAFNCSPLEHAGSAAAEAMPTCGSCVAPPLGLSGAPEHASALGHVRHGRPLPSAAVPSKMPQLPPPPVTPRPVPKLPRTLPAQTLPLQRNQPPLESPTTFPMAPSVGALAPSAAAVPPAAMPPSAAMPAAALEPPATLPPATPPPPAPPPPAHTTGADGTPASTSAASTPLQLQLRLTIPPRIPKALHVQSGRTAYRFAPLAPAPGAPAVSARVQRPLGDDSPLDSSSRRRAGTGAYWLSELKLKSTGLKSAVEGSSPRQRSIDKHFRTQPISTSTPRDESGGVLSTRQLLPYFSERSSPFKDPMPLVLCTRGEVSTRSATMKTVHC